MFDIFSTPLFPLKWLPTNLLTGDTADPAIWLQQAAARHTSADTARMAQRLLDDFRKSALGSIALELPA